MASSSEASSSEPKSTGITKLETKPVRSVVVRLRLPAEEDMPRSTLKWSSSCESSTSAPISKISRAFGPFGRLRSFSRETYVHTSTNIQETHARSEAPRVSTLKRNARCDPNVLTVTLQAKVR